MKIKRSIKEWPGREKSGVVEYIDEAKMGEIAGQTDMAFHKTGECPNSQCFYCSRPAMDRLKAGATLETFYAKYEKVN